MITDRNAQKSGAVADPADDEFMNLEFRVFFA